MTTSVGRALAALAGAGHSVSVVSTLVLPLRRAKEPVVSNEVSMSLGIVQDLLLEVLARSTQQSCGDCCTVPSWPQSLILEITGSYKQVNDGACKQGASLFAHACGYVLAA